jgi:serine protease Do
MKRWFVVVVIILVAGLAFNGYLYTRLDSSLKSVQSRINKLSSDVTVIESDVASSASALQTHTAAIENLVNGVQSLVVRVDVTSKNATDSGSGEIVDARGYVLTNNHVVSGGDSVTVTMMNGDIFDALVVATDAARDLALLKLSTMRTDFTVVSFGSISDVVIGEDIIVAGFPLGEDLPGPATITEGIVSAVRTINGLKFIQTDAKINPGNSGGCVVNLQGKVIGITVAEVLPLGEDVECLALAIPADDAVSFIQESIK